MNVCRHLRRVEVAPRPERSRRAHHALRGEEAFTIVEVVVSALILVAISLATLGAIESAGRSTAEERHRAQAYSLAQQDQARLRSMSISKLSNLAETKDVTVDDSKYTVTSKAVFVTDSTGSQTCTASTASADYISVSSTVTWPSMGSRPAAVVKSIIAPPNGSVATDRGALAILVVDGSNAPLAGVTVTGSGPSTFSGTTAEDGCVLFGNLPEGEYTLNPGVNSGLVDVNGKPPGQQTVSVIAQSTNTITLQFATPGTLNVSFTIKNTAGSIVSSTADSVMVYNPGLNPQVAQRYGTIGNRVSSVSATPLFPFSSADTVYAGTCDANALAVSPYNVPTPSGAAQTSAIVPAGGVATATVQLPALHLKVYSGNTSNQGSPVDNAHVVITDVNCTVDGTAVKRVLSTNSSGALPDPGLPWGVYDICADNGAANGPRKSQLSVSGNDVAVQSLASSGTSVNLYLGTVGRREPGQGGTDGTCS